MGIKLYLLSGGSIDADRAVIFPGDDSHRRVSIPVMQVLIERLNPANPGEVQRILIDTGLPAAAAGDSEGLERAYDMDPTWMRPIMAPSQRVDAQLKRLGLTPNDLDLVVNTHLHFDHAGGNPLFPGVAIAVQETELEAASSESYLPVWDALNLQFRVVRGDWGPMPGVEMIHTSGHSPGHQSMLVRVGKQPWLFTWDAVYTEEHWRTGKLGAVDDVAAARESLERLHAIAAGENARIIFGHDMGQWESLGMRDEPKLIAED